MNYRILVAPFLIAVLLCGAPAAGAQSSDAGSQSSLSSIIIYTEDIEALARFYRQALQLGEPATVLDVHIGFWMGSNYLAFEPLEGPAGRGAGATAWYGVEDVEAAIERSVAAGATAGMPPTRQSWGDTHATVFDPDGNLLGLIESGGQDGER